MSKNYNSMSFTPEEVSKGLHLKLITNLLEISNELECGRYDILITSDGYCTIINWCEHNFDEDSGRFEYIDEDEYVFKEIRFPDGHYGYAQTEDEEKELWEQFHQEHPEWVKTPHGTWTNEEENKRWLQGIEANRGGDTEQ